MKPKNTGLVELVDEKRKEQGFFCMNLVEFINEEAEMGTEHYMEVWEERFTAARLGNCEYHDRCPIYKRTAKNRPVQLNIFT